MMINSNDIFSKIGLIVNPRQLDISFKSQPKFTAFLQIELGEDQKHILQVKDTDDPRIIAQQFCREHRLNHLAVNLVQQKVIEALEYEKVKPKKLNHKYYKTDSIGINQQKQKKKTNISNNKTSCKPTSSVTPQKNSKSYKKTNNNTKISDSIYLRGMIKTKLLEEERNKKKAQKQRSQQEELTFKPRINDVSEKIVEFLRTSKSPKPSKKYSPTNKLYEQMQQCTFKPKINKISERIVNNRSALKEERQLCKMHYQSNEQSEKTPTKNKKKTEDKHLFRPQINPKSADIVTVPFFKRLQIAIQKKSKQKTSFYDQEQCSFHPKVGRAPKIYRDKQNRTVWDHLYEPKKNKGHICTVGTSKISQSSNSSHIYENLVQQRIRQVFSALDNDQDGLISPQQIGIQNIPPGTLVFLKPILIQMDEIQAVLNFYEFRKAVYALMADSDPGTKGTFISEKWWSEKPQKQQFRPSINKKSKQLTVTRSSHNLYQDGLRELQAKQYRLQKQRAQKQENQLSECSFMPVLNHSSKIYIDKIMKRKQITKNQQSITDIINNYIPE